MLHECLPQIEAMTLVAFEFIHRGRHLRSRTLRPNARDQPPRIQLRYGQVLDERLADSRSAASHR